jgi:hypothetical protein
VRRNRCPLHRAEIGDRRGVEARDLVRKMFAHHKEKRGWHESQDTFAGSKKPDAARLAYRASCTLKAYIRLSDPLAASARDDGSATGLAPP